MPGTGDLPGGRLLPRAGGTSLTLAELWNGSAWKALPTPNPSGGHGSVLTAVSCESASACTAVGSYRNNAGTAATLAETWNGAGWQIQPTPNPAGSFESYLTGVSCPAAAACTAVGYYENQSFQDNAVAFAESWDGTAWTLQPVPVAGAVQSHLYAVSCTGATACTATGSYSDSTGNAAVPLAEAWNGTSWTFQATPVPSGAFSSALTGVSCTAAASCIAVGNYDQNRSPFAELTLAEVWNGSTWTIQPTPNPGSYGNLAAVSCVTATSCTAVGWQGPSFVPKHALAEVWDGIAWTAQAPAQPSGAADSTLAGVSCTGARTCAAVGSAYHAFPGAWRTLAESRPGTAWAIQASPSVTGALGTSLPVFQATPLVGVSCATSAACVAVGTVARAWNGTAWANLAFARPPGASNIVLGAVSCTAASACMAVGRYDDASGALRPLAESWDGSTWHLVAVAEPAGATNITLGGVSCTAASTCMAVGSYDDTSGTAVTLAESWNGTNWSVLTTLNPDSNGNFFNAVSCTAASSCTAVGSGGNRPLAEAWNGTAWSQEPTPGSGFGPLLSVSCTAASACAAVGSVGTHAQAGIWNGTAWTMQRLPVPTGSNEAALNGVACTGPGECTAVGYSLRYSDFNSLTLAEAWNGTAWTVQPTPNPPHAQVSGFSGVSCTSGGACTAVGNAGPLVGLFGVDVPLAEQRP